VKRRKRASPVRYPESPPYAQGYLDVGAGNLIFWEQCGNPRGKPALVVHGGPGSGCSPWHRCLFDPATYSVTLFDQRNCGRSTPHAALRETSLESNTTPNLVEDMEKLRQHLGVDRWLLLGGSWGSTLSLVYAETHPTRVTEMILFGVTTGQRKEFDWLFRGGLQILFPQEWERLRDWSGTSLGRDGDVVEAYHRLLNDPDEAVCSRAAEEWCRWESVTPAWPPSGKVARRFADPQYALAFARIVTHYVRRNAWVEDGILLRKASVLLRIPGALINGRFDFQAPIAGAWELKRAWPNAALVIVEDAGHAASAPNITMEIIRATDQFAASRRG
jgi:proline iminopeptidase